MDEDVRDEPEQEGEDDPRQPGGNKPSVKTWPVVPGGKPGRENAEE